jgi:hypothetical protein
VQGRREDVDPVELTVALVPNGILAEERLCPHDRNSLDRPAPGLPWWPRRLSECCISRKALARFDKLRPDLVKLLDAKPKGRPENADGSHRAVGMIDHGSSHGSYAFLPFLVLDCIAACFGDVEMRPKDLPVSDRSRRARAQGKA